MCVGEVHVNSTRFLHSSLFPPGQGLEPRVTSLEFYGPARAPTHARGPVGRALKTLVFPTAAFGSRFPHPPACVVVLDFTVTFSHLYAITMMS